MGSQVSEKKGLLKDGWVAGVYDGSEEGGNVEESIQMEVMCGY